MLALPTGTMLSFASRSPWRDFTGGKRFVSGFQCACSVGSYRVHGFSSTWFLQDRRLLQCPAPGLHGDQEYPGNSTFPQHSPTGSLIMEYLWWDSSPCIAFLGEADYQQVPPVASKQFLCYSVSHGHVLFNKVWKSAGGKGGNLPWILYLGQGVVASPYIGSSYILYLLANPSLLHFLVRVNNSLY